MENNGKQQEVKEEIDGVNWEENIKDYVQGMECDFKYQFQCRNVWRAIREGQARYSNPIHRICDEMFKFDETNLR